MGRVVGMILGILLVASGVARAHDHRAPRSALLLEGGIQKGQRYHADWARPARQEGFCFVSFAHGFPTPPKALPHALGEPVVVRLYKKAMPLEVEAQRWPRVNRDGMATGTPVPLPWSLRPHEVNGEIRAWDVVIPWPRTLDHLYLGVAGYWRDEEGCSSEPDLGSQYAAWTFHLRALAD